MNFTIKSAVLLAVACLALVVGITTPVSAENTNNFTITSYHIDYYLGRDETQHSNLKTVETITAEFPTYDQNHGIERAIPRSYDGHPVRPHLTTVTNETGLNLTHTTYSSNDNLVIRIGDANRYVHGRQTYRINYTQQDVTKYFSDTGADEFYWDTNGTDWRVPISSFTAAVHFDKSIAGMLSGKQSCYIGVAGSNQTCELTPISDGFEAKTDYLAPGQNISVAFGFPPHTFAAYTPTQADRFASLAQGLAAVAAVTSTLSIPIAFVVIIILAVRYSWASSRRREHTTIVPEYLPPKDTSVTVAASILAKQTTVFSAQLIDFAVRHYTKIYQTREKSFFRPAQYEIEIIRDITDLHDEEQEIFRDIFPSTAVGSRLNLTDLKKDTTLYLRVSDNKKKLDANIRGKYGLRARDPQASAWFKRAALVLLIMAVLTLSLALGITALISFILAWTLYPLTDKGLALYHYLEGLKLYIKTAETDRLKMLQSPEGALKIGAPIDTTDTRQLVKLYERVLPYAILFGLEKDWNAQLGRYYEAAGQSPDWYSSNTSIFTAATLSSAISNFNSAAAYSGAANASSGGSSGGGSSGGGGGGGGGGGW